MKVLKILGGTIAAVAGLLIVAAVAIWLLFDPNDYKRYLTDWISERTGREFVIEDDLELTLFPWLGVTTGNIRVGNAPGFGADPFAAIERATISVQLMPLLSRRVEVSTVRLDGLELNLATDAENRNNWSDLLTADAPDGADTATSTPREPFLQSLNIAGISVTESLVFWRENTTEVRYVLSDLRINTGAITPGAPVDGEIRFRIVGVEPQLSADVTASATAVFDTANSNLSARNIRVAFNLADGGGNERAAGSLELDSVRLALAEDAVEFARGNLTAMVNSPPVGPEQTEIAVDWTAGLFRNDEAMLTLTDLATTAAGMTARWELTGRDLFADPQLAGSVRLTNQPVTALIDALGVAVDAASRPTLGMFSVESTFAIKPLAREATLSGLTASVLGVVISGELATSADGSARGRFSAGEFDPARLLSLLPPATLAQIDVTALGPTAASGDIRYDGATGRLAADNLELRIMGTRMTGNVNRLNGGARYDGQLVIPALNATTLANAAGELLPEALPPTALGTLTLRARFGYAPDAGTLELTELSARAAELDLNGNLRGTNLADSPSWTGRIEVSQFDPSTLLARFDHPVPARTDPTTLTRARVAADIEINATRSVFRNLNLLLDDSTITGELTATFAEPAEYDFRLAIDRLDADRYMPPATEAPAGAAPVAADIALPTEPLRTMHLDGALTVGQLAIAGLRMSSVATTLAVGEGLGVVDSARASLYGGNFEGRLELDTRGEETRLALTGAATTVQLEPLLTDLYGEANMTGAGSFDLSLSGLGEQLSSALDSSEGRVAFSLRDGEFRGFNLGRAMCSAYNTTQKLPRPAAAAEITRFSLLRGSATVAEGVARTRDLEATTAFLAVTGQGQSDLLSREINYNLVARMTGSIGINGCESMDPLIGDSIPVRATGTITEPDIQPDYGEIVRQRLRGEVQDRLRERLQNLGR